jgi:hypothetical protein
MMRMRNFMEKHSLLAIIAAAAFLSLASCSAAVSSAIRSDGGARISVQAEVPAVLAAKFRKLAAMGSGGEQAGAIPFFDAGAIRKAIAARPSLRLIGLSQPSPDSIRAEIDVKNLEEFALSPDLKGSGLLTLSKGKDWAECRFRLERRGVEAIAGLFPGIDPFLMEALAPPALEEDPVTAADYESMLRSILGEKATATMKAASLTIAFSAPGAIIDSGGGELESSVLTAKIPVIQALVLEKPIEIWLRWKN